VSNAVMYMDQHILTIRHTYKTVW